MRDRSRTHESHPTPAGSSWSEPEGTRPDCRNPAFRFGDGCPRARLPATTDASPRERSASRESHRLRSMRRSRPREAAVFGISLIAFSLYMLLSRRVEIRQKGLASSGMLYSWSRIDSYTCGPKPGEFTLHLRTTTRWFPTRLLVRKELRSQFEDALTRQLSEWPRRSG